MREYLRPRNVGRFLEQRHDYGGSFVSVSEGIRKSGVLERLIFAMLPQKKSTVAGANVRVLPVIAFISAFLNNTPVVVIFAPIIRTGRDG